MRRRRRTGRERMMGRGRRNSLGVRVCGFFFHSPGVMCGSRGGGCGLLAVCACVRGWVSLGHYYIVLCGWIRARHHRILLFHGSSASVGVVGTSMCAL